MNNLYTMTAHAGEGFSWEAFMMWAEANPWFLFWSFWIVVGVFVISPYFQTPKIRY